MKTLFGLQIEMLEWKGEDVSPNKDSSIEKYQIIAGTGYTTPNNGTLVEGK